MYNFKQLKQYSLNGWHKNKAYRKEQVRREMIGMPRLFPPPHYSHILIYLAFYMGFNVYFLTTGSDGLGKAKLRDIQIH